MMTDWRIQKHGQGLNYTCENAGYKTNIEKGKPHGVGNPKGNALHEALYNEEGTSLWLEHVVDKKTGADCFWLMWYINNGKSSLTMSSIFNKKELIKLINNLKKIKIEDIEF